MQVTEYIAEIIMVRVFFALDIFRTWFMHSVAKHTLENAKR